MDITNFYNELNAKVENNKDLKENSALSLAYIGDAVFELCVRNKILVENNATVNDFNVMARNYVKASSQAKMYHKVFPFLSEEEASIIKRGRNAKSGSVSKKAEVLDYRHATGLETLFGYLFLKGENKRLIELFEICTQQEEKVE